jgi:hypothetical protein
MNKLMSSKPTVQEIKHLESLTSIPNQPKVSAGIDKNEILANYQDSWIAKGIQDQVITAVKGKTSQPMTYPSHYQLIFNCKIKPSLNLYYRVKDLRLDNVVIFLVKWYKLYLTDIELDNLKSLNSRYCEMIDDVLRLRSVDFSMVKLPHLDYAKQTEISEERVDLATTCAIHYGLSTGMVIRYIKGEYVGKSRNADVILTSVSPHINNKDCQHIKCTINQGCLSQLNFEEEYKNKHAVLRKGNQHTFLQHPEVRAKAMNKEERNSHVLPFKEWLVYFSPYCRATPQGIQEKYGKFRVIFDSLMQTAPNEVVLNRKTSTDFEAVIDFGKAKMNLLINIYNWGVSYPRKMIYLALANITACFRFPRIFANVVGAFGYVAKEKYFVSTSHVFGSNT